MLTRDLNLFNDCEPEAVADWSPEANCSFCSLPLDKLSVVAPATALPLPSPSDFSLCQAPNISESSQTAHKFLQAVFHKNDASVRCDASIPRIAQDLMKKMIRQFAMEYASKCLLRTTSTEVTTRSSSPFSSETSDVPLDLTVSRTKEETERESDADGVLDLSQKNDVSTTSSNVIALGCPPPCDEEELGNREKRTAKRRSALDVVLDCLCPAHRSLLYQMLKLAHKENLLSSPARKAVFPTESHCRRCGLGADEVTLEKCTTRHGASFCPLSDCAHQGCTSPTCLPGELPLKACRGVAPFDLNGHSTQSCTTDTRDTLMCPKRLRCTFSQGLPADQIESMVCSFAPRSAVCCSRHPDPYLRVRNRARVSHLNATTGDRDPPPPVLKREQSPSPPPLSPIQSDIQKSTDEMPPSLLHHKQEGEAARAVKDHPNMHRELIVAAAKRQALESRTPTSSQVENQSGTLLQDVVNRFSEKLDTIRPPAPAPASSAILSEQEQRRSSTSQNLQFPADAHLTEIITTVLHTHSPSDYNLSELFNRHDSKGSRLPNTRFRRRQEALAAMARKADGATSRRQSLKIKRELAMLDASCGKRRSSRAKRSPSNRVNGAVNASGPLLDFNLMPEEERETERNTDRRSLNGLPLNSGPASSRNAVKADETRGKKEGEMDEKDLSQAISHDLQSKFSNPSSRDADVQPQVEAQCERRCQEDKVSANCHAGIFEYPPSGQRCGTADRDDGSVEKQSQIIITDCHPGHENPNTESRRSRRNIVPPQRFSSYVTETRKMFFSIFNQRTPNKNDVTCGTSEALFQHGDVKSADFESKTKPSNLPDTFVLTGREGNCSSRTESTEQNQDVQQTPAVKETACTAKPLGETRPYPKRPISSTASRRLQYPNVSVMTRSAACAKDTCTDLFQYASPIKLMFVSPLKEGVIYRLKSAKSCSDAQAEEVFDPCKESSWAGTPEKKESQITECSLPPTRANGKSMASFDTSPRHMRSSPSQRLKSGASPAEPPLLTPICASGSSPAKLLSSHQSSSAESAPAPFKSGSSPAKSSSSSPKSSGKCTSSSPKTKMASKRSGEVTPPKNPFGMESQRSSRDLQSFHEIAPLKRRPGRPKKLGPHLEQKVKRPIGRPRKQKPERAAAGTGVPNVPADMEGKVNKNLKITVVYGRSRRNKRMVSESFDQLQTEFSNACLKKDPSVARSYKMDLSNPEMDSPEFPQGLHDANPIKEATLHPSSRIKCQKRESPLPSRKPGRPAKVKISGISVTVTTVSPKQRQIWMGKESPKRKTNKKALLPRFQHAQGPRKTVGCPSVCENLQPAGPKESQRKNGRAQNQPLAVRHSKRVSKPSVYFLHAVATCRTPTYSHSNALLRRSKQLLLNKACNQRKQERHPRIEHSVLKGRPCQLGPEDISQELTRIAAISLDSIFAPKETLRWWATSAEERTLNQELARRIQLISDTWVSDTVENRRVDFQFQVNTGSSSSASKSKHSSVVQTLFSCPPTKPRSCSMQQLSSWFMETTETQSLAIVKKTGSRNHYEVMHFPRSVNKRGGKCQSPQAERLRRHVKKFAKTLPKSPLQHEKAQKRLREMKGAPSIQNTRHRLRGTRWRRRRRRRPFSKYKATLLRVRKLFQTQKERKWAKERYTQGTACRPHTVVGLGPKEKAVTLPSDGLESSPGAESEEPKERKICSKAWSPESIKECRVFLKKIKSADDKAAQEWDACTVTLDEKSASAFVFAGKKRQLVGVVRAVKRKRCADGSGATPSVRESLQMELDEMPLGRRKGKCPGLASARAPPAKKLRQSRMKGLSGPRWCDFVLGS
ncbi:uncharacterized protein lcorl isoform X2 [Syngnathoides biaculeatus]|nr:uncharacterized protein lcorl isoform X2 [Syngnathoides biaculeatus]XP_061685631.1 uncharacterized protein lcorl isoform X2 [Syngnathoides biaculeatus]